MGPNIYDSEPEIGLKKLNFRLITAIVLLRFWDQLKFSEARGQVPRSGKIR